MEPTWPVLWHEDSMPDTPFWLSPAGPWCLVRTLHLVVCSGARLDCWSALDAAG